MAWVLNDISCLFEAVSPADPFDGGEISDGLDNVYHFLPRLPCFQAQTKPHERFQVLYTLLCKPRGQELYCHQQFHGVVS